MIKQPASGGVGDNRPRVPVGFLSIDPAPKLSNFYRLFRYDESGKCRVAVSRDDFRLMEASLRLGSRLYASGRIG